MEFICSILDEKTFLFSYFFIGNQDIYIYERQIIYKPL